jgi:hypothetical protein
MVSVFPIGLVAARTDRRSFFTCDPNVRDIDHTDQLPVTTFCPRLRSWQIRRFRAVAAPRPPNAMGVLDTGLFSASLAPKNARCRPRFQ